MAEEPPCSAAAGGCGHGEGAVAVAVGDGRGGRRLRVRTRRLADRHGRGWARRPMKASKGGWRR